jgi:mycothiol synthase
VSDADLRLEARSRLDGDEIRAVGRLVDEVTDADGVRPLSEHVMLHLRYGGDHSARNLLGYRNGELVGYAHLDVSDAVAGPSAELAVRPDARRQGIGRRLTEWLLAESAGRDLRLWAHGAGPAESASGLASALGFRRDRTLWQMRRSLYAAIPARPVPEGVEIRTFGVGRDESAWVELNNRAFAGHPEQGGWTTREVEVREREPWFDPAGFFLAERSGQLVGFHWTKVHGTEDGDHEHRPIGEVYVVGVDPDERGSGLAPALLVLGLRHLRNRGLPEVMLYVDEDNRRAVRLYESLGFGRWDIDVSFRHPASGGGTAAEGAAGARPPAG